MAFEPRRRGSGKNAVVELAETGAFLKRGEGFPHLVESASQN